MQDIPSERDASTTNQPAPSRTDLLQPPVLEAELPADVAAGLGRLLGEDPVPTLEDWVTAVRRHTGGGAIAVEDLCHADGTTPHRGELDGDTYYFRCFYDAILLAAAVDRPVDIRTRSPTGSPIKATAVGDTGLTVDPPAAVFSLGVGAAVDPPGKEGPTNEDVYAAVCPWVRAFPDTSAYENWAATVPAATVALPFSTALTVAGALLD